jgi:hypothetical protein
LDKLNLILDWMDEQFDGDLEDLKIKAFQKTIDDDIVEELWSEIGGQVLGYLYGSYRIRPERNRTLKNMNFDSSNYEITKEERQAMNEKYNNKIASYNKLFQPYYVNGHYIDILNMTKEDCLIVAGDYDERANSNAFERDFFLNIANNLRDKQKVKDVFTLNELRRLRVKNKGKKFEAV